MKRLKNKVFRKRNAERQPPSRITNETVAEHRERILAGGRKFKYPVQYARHRLVINTILISVAVIILLVLIGWWQLYSAQNTSTFIYRLTQLVPVPIADVNGAQARYSDYLMRYRSSMHFLQQQNMINLGSGDGQRQVEHVKRQSLNEAEANAFARQLAQKHNVSVTSTQVDEFIKKERESQKSRLSEEAFESVVLRGFYDWSVSEYREVVESNLLRRKVAFAVDDTARKKIRQAAAELTKKKANFAKIAQKYSDDTTTAARGGTVGFVPKNSQDPNGLVAEAKRLKKGEVSKIITGSDGYYIVKHIESNDNQISYARIKISLGEFERQLKALKANGKVNEYIQVPDSPKESRR